MPDPIQNPVPVKELDQHFKTRGPLKETPISIERRFHIAADHQPKVTTRLERVERGDNKVDWQVIIEIDGVRAGGRAQPPELKGEATKIEIRKISEEQLAKQLTSFVPDHLGM